MEVLSTEEIKFIRILASSDSTTIQKGMDPPTKKFLVSHIGKILQEYYKEKTTQKPQNWIKKFEEAEISEEDVKAAIACIRRLGVDIF